MPRTHSHAHIILGLKIQSNPEPETIPRWLPKSKLRCRQWRQRQKL
jgi:hypothetical protein